MDMGSLFETIPGTVLNDKRDAHAMYGLYLSPGLRVSGKLASVLLYSNLRFVLTLSFFVCVCLLA